ncbi:MAG TPA: hypothetical protein VM659_00960 [Dongiaceae bacterium]|nr:hypothetical protein [Dongiaceae bacterium]
MKQIANRLHRLELVLDEASDESLGDRLLRARLRWEADPAGMEKERCEAMKNLEESKCAGIRLSSLGARILRAHERIAQLRQTEVSDER